MRRNNMTEPEYQIEEVYEAVYGDRGIDCYTHDELMDMLNQMYDCYEWVCNFKSEVAMHKDLKELRGVE
jgi:hypothetical protein